MMPNPLRVHDAKIRSPFTSQKALSGVQGRVKRDISRTYLVKGGPEGSESMPSRKR